MCEDRAYTQFHGAPCSIFTPRCVAPGSASLHAAASRRADARIAHRADLYFTAPRSRPSASARPYLYFVTWAGFANRVLALLSALVLAILTDRVLLVDDDAFPAHLFELPIRWLASECAYFSALPRTSDEWRVVETEQKPFTAELA